MIKIDRVGLEKLDDLVEIDKNNFDDSWNKEMFKKELEHENSQYYALFNDDKIIGFIGGWYVAKEYQINKFVIDKPHQDKKLGQLFLIYVMELYKTTKGIEKSTIEVRESNKKAIKVYTKAGFDVVGRRPDYYQNNNEDAYVMIREFCDEY